MIIIKKTSLGKTSLFQLLLLRTKYPKTKGYKVTTLLFSQNLETRKFEHALSLLPRACGAGRCRQRRFLHKVAGISLSEHPERTK